MTPAEQAAFEPILRDRERDALEQLRAGAESARPPSLDEEIGRLTRQDALQQQQMALHAQRRLETQLATIRGALARITEGTFGSCPLCNGDVGTERLEFAPETPFCVGCQGDLERDGRR